MSISEKFRIRCGMCPPAIGLAIFDGPTLEEAHGKLVEHATKEHPEMMGEDIVWESTYIEYFARKVSDGKTT